jgi:hypothetical protein
MLRLLKNTLYIYFFPAREWGSGIFLNPTPLLSRKKNIGKYLDNFLVSKNLPLFPKISLKKI